MKRRALLGLMAAFGYCACTVGNSEEKIFNENKYDTVLTFVNLVQKRYYVIRRLEGAVDHLLSRYGAVCGKNRGCLLERELSLVNSFWQDCLSYKHIMSDRHIRELLAHLIVLYDGLLKICGKESGLAITREAFSKRGLGELLDTVDVLSAMSRDLCASHPLDENSLRESLLGEKIPGWQPLGLKSSELPHFFFLERNEGEEPAAAEPDGEVLGGAYRSDDFLVNTTLRFYLLQRLAVPIEQLSKIACSSNAACLCAQLPPVDSFQSQPVRECLQKIGTELSLQPLLKLWERVSSYRYIGDPYLIREMLLIVVQVYKVLMKFIVPSQEQVEVQDEQVLDVYTTISSLPLPELLMLLDELTQQSSSVIAAYQEGTALGWQATFKHYWWVPPVMIAGCATLYLRIHKLLWHPHYRQGSI